MNTFTWNITSITSNGKTTVKGMAGVPAVGQSIDFHGWVEPPVTGIVAAVVWVRTNEVNVHVQ